MAYHKIPLYRQISNTSGLSAVLMVAKPEGSSLELLLNDIVKRIGELKIWNTPGAGDLKSWLATGMKWENQALFWQVASAYLLMKCSFNRSLGHYLRRNFQSEYRSLKKLHYQQLEKRMTAFLSKENKKAALDIFIFLNKGIVRKTVLSEYLSEMKTPLELKILAFLFGGTQQPESLSLTGVDNTKTIQTLIQNVPQGIICDLGNYWVAVQGIEHVRKESYNFIIHDPKGMKRPITSDRIPTKARFYCFQFEPVKRKEMDPIVRRALKLPTRKK
ncbi:MAG: hypothetical protein HWN66_02760 [Candidatus Helarchaeota archaeon]|nr:hypothetical protein [Candidatus Helarchaeota archaeon]